jgi:hypothetical protein
MVVLTLAMWPAVRAGTWDALLSNSHWYVPQENLLAYMSSSTSFTTPPPISLWDQTLWSLGTATDGRFTGSSQATFYVSPEVSFSSTTSILGLATEIGQIRMRFTPTSGGSTVIGIGQFRDVSGTTAMQMQMISGQAGEAYTTHWAYMLPYDPGSFMPPDPRPNSALTSTEWAWTLGTTWAYQSDQLFGPGGVGSFTITDYRNEEKGDSHECDKQWSGRQFKLKPDSTRSAHARGSDHRRRTLTSIAPVGRMVAKKTGRGRQSGSGSTIQSRKNAASSMRPSNSNVPLPMQKRLPPPNGK